MAQITLNSTGVASNGALVLQSNGTTTAVTISTGQVATLAKDAVVNGLTVGRGAGDVSTNTAVGKSALASNTTGVENTAFGVDALNINSTGNYNVALGLGANKLNTTGSNNTSVGYLALLQNTTASNNTAVGYQSVYSNTTGDNNVGIGWKALYANTTGLSNSAVGLNALLSNTTGGSNVAMGQQALQANTTGGENTSLGYQAGYSIVTGAYFTCIGSGAGGTIGNGTGNYGTYVGNQAVGSGNNTSSELVVCSGTGSTGKGTSTGFINPNGGGVYQGNNSSTWSTTSDQRLKKNIVDNTNGLSKITSIRVRNFEYKLPEEVTELDSSCAVANTGVQLGVIAQELQQILPECVKTESTGVMTVDTDNLTWYLVNAIKELKAEIDLLKGA